MGQFIVNIQDEVVRQIVHYTEKNNISVNEMTERLWVDFLKENQLKADFAYYRDCFDQLNCAYHKEMGFAPHKPILLMSVIKLFESCHYQTSQLKITPLLESVFKSEWKKYVKSHHTMNLAQPFYHLKNEPFWQLHIAHYHADFENSSKMKTLSNLKKIVDYAIIDKALTQLLLDENSRTQLYEFLVWRYFDNRQNDSKQTTLLAKLKHGLGDKFTQFKVIFDDVWLPKAA